MTVVRISGERLLLHSPVPLDGEIGDEIDGLGRVEQIVAPNCYHHMYLAAARERYPEATVWGAPGLAAKVKGLHVDRTFADDGDPDWSSELPWLVVEGLPRWNEVVFLHPPSRTLIATDLIIHVPEVKSWVTRLMLRLIGVYGRPAQAWIWRWSVKDRPAVERSVERILAWDFDRVVMSHGEILETGGRETLAGVLAWMRPDS
jgi:hypothetical protein